MNRRKIENWVIFCLKMLPFLFLIIFSIFVHRHDIPESVTDTVNIPFSPFEVGFEWIAGETTLSRQNVSDPTKTSNLYYFSTGNSAYNYSIRWDSDEQAFFVEGVMNDNYFNFTESYIHSDALFNATLTRVQLILSEDCFLGFPSETIFTYYNTPLEVYNFYFNTYINRFYSFNIFNINDFYDWTVNSWFNGNAPLIYKSVFSILVYELIIDLLFLMYSFITFIIKFAQKWLNGIYNKEL